MAIVIAKLMLIKCQQDHGKHTVEKFSYVSRTPMRSCAICVDMTEGLFDWEIQLLSDIPDFKLPERQLMAANIHNVARSVARV